MICCRGTADEAMTAMRAMMSKLRLTVNEAKTRLCRVPEETFDFLGYTIGRCYSPQTGTVLHRDATVGEEDRSDSVGRDQRVDRPSVGLARRVEDRVARLNRKLLGWSNYFCLGPVSQAYRAIDRHALPPAPPVAARQAQGEEPGMSRFPDRVPARACWA